MFDTFSQAEKERATSQIGPGNPLATSIEVARSQQDRYFGTFGPAVSVATSRQCTVQGPHGPIPIRLTFPHAQVPVPCIVFLRGAGFWAGGLDSHAVTAHGLTTASGCAVCAVDFRRTPEYRYPVQRDEVLAVLCWLRSEGDALGLTKQEPVLFGESAGATLALSAALELRDNRAPAPVGLLLFYANAAGPKQSARPYSQWVWHQYLGSADPAAVPGPVPIAQPLHNLPPVWLACGEDDPLVEDSLALAARLAAADVPVTLHTLPSLPHAFLMYSSSLRPAHDALVRAAAAARVFLDLQPLNDPAP